MVKKERVTVDTSVLAGKAFKVSCTLETLFKAMPMDREGGDVPAHFMVGMLASMAKELAEELFELPLVLEESQKEVR